MRSVRIGFRAQRRDDDDQAPPTLVINQASAAAMVVHAREVRFPDPSVAKNVVAVVEGSFNDCQSAGDNRTDHR
jgi:hypothetical protein